MIEESLVVITVNIVIIVVNAIMVIIVSICQNSKNRTNCHSSSNSDNKNIWSNSRRLCKSWPESTYCQYLGLSRECGNISYGDYIGTM